MRITLWKRPFRAYRWLPGLARARFPRSAGEL
jgi:hypothetical protein